MKIPSFLKKEKLITKLEIKPEEIRMEDIIAPPSLKIKQNYLKIGERLCKSFFVFSYPRYLSTGWLSPVINLNYPLDLSLHIHPVDSSQVLKQLRKKLTEIEAELMEREEKGLIRDPSLETAHQDIKRLREDIQTARERVFRFGLYITIYGDNQKELRRIETTLRSIFESRLVYIKPALFREKEGFVSSLPYGLDRILVHNPMNTAPLSSIFPFVSPDLSANEGVLYGLNQHNNSLVLFDRFTLENANSCVFGKAGSGKSLTKLQKVLCNIKGRASLLEIGSLVEKLIKKHGATQIDEELEGVINPEIEVYSFNKNLKGEWSKVTVAARKKAPQVFYKFRTRSGREVTTTGDHNMVILKNGKVVIVRGSEINRGEFIPLSREIHKNISESQDYLNKIAKDLEIEKSFLISGELLRIAGFLTSEGTVKKTVSNKIISISNADPEILKKLKRDLRKLKIPHSEIIKRKSSKKKVVGIKITSSLFGTLKSLGAYGISAQKKIWPFIFGLEKEKIGQYLSAYFEGDGGVEKQRVQVVATSKSERLISEIAYLLLYFGIIGRIAKTKKKPTNCNWKRRKSYWKISISGQDNLRKFAENINFISKRKRGELEEIIKKERNTNVDLIPGLEPVFREIHQLISPQLYGIAEISEWKRGVRHPSPQHLLRVINKIEERIQYFKDLGSTFKVLSELPELSSVIDLERNNKGLNRELWQVLGDSWRLMKNQEVQPKSINAFKAIAQVSGEHFTLGEIKKVLYQGFREMDLLYYDRSIQSALKTHPKSNNSYKMIQKSAQFVWQNYQDILKNKIPKVEEKLNQLKVLANSELFWDPIVEIKKIENKKEKYVYDLTVDNEVFLAGEGGMFVHNSYALKLEVLRSLMQQSDAIIIDPENEYEFLSDAVGGSFFSISLTSPNHVNPFDLPPPREDERASDILRSSVINLVGLLRIMLGGLSPREDAIIDRALTETYAAKDITPESDPSAWPEKIPLMSDLETVLSGMEGTESLVERLGKFTRGSYAGFFNQPSNISMENKFVVFGIRDMEEELRPMAMFIILRYIWNTVRATMKKRILLVDEAWWLMKTEDGASFLFGICKRARKYWLGVSTITQDINDFMKSKYGQPIITNSSLQLLMKQSPATIDILQKAFNLTNEEKYLLLECAVGEGIFIAGTKRVALKVVASYAEDQIITTAPEEVLKARRAKKLKKEAEE